MKLLNQKSIFKKLSLFQLLFTGLVLMSVTPFSEPRPDDNFKFFLEQQPAITNIFSLQNQNLTQGQAAFEIWSGSYWPIHQGLLAHRYADPAFPKSKNFLENYNHYQSITSDNLVQNGLIQNLSPAEKYDLLVGDKNWTFTKFMWNRGLISLQKLGHVPTWTGICHGWSAAVHMGLKAPEKSIKVWDATGQYEIEFYKQDIKALISYLWAESITSSINVGNRCRQDVVIKDPYLRPIDAACLDSNPMTWHLAVTNRTGLYKKSFVMDSTFDSEVWNFAIKGYDYSYFNPRTFQTTHQIKAAIEPIENLTADKYRIHRSSKAKYIVGIVMDVFIPSLMIPRVQDGKNDRTKIENFIYDLELDEFYNIVGGEWHSARRPDFLWSYTHESQAMNEEDYLLTEKWNLKNELPESFAKKALEASRRGKVLNRITDALHQESLKSN